MNSLLEKYGPWVLVTGASFSIHVAGRINRIMGEMGKQFLFRRTNTNMWGSLMKKITPKQLMI